MPRNPVIRSNEYFYHISARSNNKEYWYLPIHDVWKILCDELLLLQLEMEIEISAFVLMDNHFHLLMRTPTESIDRVMYFFMKRSTLKMQKKSNRINRIYGGRYKGSLIEDERYLFNVYKYIYRNPVKAEMCSLVEEYQFSTLNVSTSFNVTSFFDDLFLAKSLEQQRLFELQWLNQSFSKVEDDTIKRGISKTLFTYKVDRASGKRIAPSTMGRGIA